MSKGIASRNSLKALAYPLQQFLAGWGARARPTRADGSSGTLPAPYELAALRGEGVLRARFFGPLLEKLPVTLDAEEQIALWHSLVEEGGQINAWVQRLGIAKALRREAVMPSDVTNESRKLYVILLDALMTEAPELLEVAVEGFFTHVWKARFSDTSRMPEKATQAEVLRDRLVRLLRRQLGEMVDVKESFQQSPESVRFSLLYKRQSVGRWEEIVSVDRPRLKTARLAGYETALKSVNERG